MGHAPHAPARAPPPRSRRRCRQFWDAIRQRCWPGGPGNLTYPSSSCARLDWCRCLPCPGCAAAWTGRGGLPGRGGRMSSCLATSPPYPRHLPPVQLFSAHIVAYAGHCTTFHCGARLDNMATRPFSDAWLGAGGGPPHYPSGVLDTFTQLPHRTAHDANTQKDGADSTLRAHFAADRWFTRLVMRHRRGRHRAGSITRHLLFAATRLHRDAVPASCQPDAHLLYTSTDMDVPTTQERRGTADLQW